MAFVRKNLSVLNYSNGFTLWHYRTEDDAAVVDGVGYFNDASSMFRIGDFLLVNTGYSTVPHHGIMVVVGNNDGLVDISNVTSVGLINSD